MKNIFWKKCHTLYLLYIGIGIIGIVIGRYEKFHIGILSVSADKKIEFIGLYRYRPIWKKAYRSYTGIYIKLCLSDDCFIHKKFQKKLNASCTFLDSITCIAFHSQRILIRWKWISCIFILFIKSIHEWNIIACLFNYPS